MPLPETVLTNSIPDGIDDNLRKAGDDTVLDKGLSREFPGLARELERMQHELEQLREEVRTRGSEVQELRGWR